jgi:hypothetical protein
MPHPADLEAGEHIYRFLPPWQQLIPRDSQMNATLLPPMPVLNKSQIHAASPANRPEPDMETREKSLAWCV